MRIKENHTHANQGFSLVDVIITSFLIVVMITITYPYASSYLNLQKIKEEQDIQKQIINAMAAMAEEEGALTAVGGIVNIADLADDLQPYTSLTEDQIRIDAWGNLRYYRHISENRNYRDATVVVNYAFLYSTGEGVASAPGRGCYGGGLNTECDPDVYEPIIEGLLTVAADYKDLEAPLGDVMTTYTDLQLRTDQYNITRERMEAVVEALSEFSTIQRFEAIANNQNENLIFFPPANDGAYSAAIYGLSAEAESEVLNITGGSNFNTTVSGSAANEVIRRRQMELLMSFIGLPEEFCCTPLYKIEQAPGVWMDRGLYYYSNPRVLRVNGTCSARAGVNDRKLPARLSLERYSCG